MKSITPILLAATLAVAAPTNFTETLVPRGMFQGSVEFFTRYDCQNDCVADPGWCLAGQVDEGMQGSDSSWIGDGTGCFHRPESAHSLKLTIDNGHKYTAIDHTCEHIEKYGWDGVRTWNFEVDKCHVMNGDVVKAIQYEWV